jgi:hypothetical protein
MAAEPGGYRTAMAEHKPPVDRDEEFHEETPQEFAEQPDREFTKMPRPGEAEGEPEDAGPADEDSAPAATQQQ